MTFALASRRAIPLVLALAVSAGCSAPASEVVSGVIPMPTASGPVTIDGEMIDWAGRRPIALDREDFPAAAVDLAAVRESHDAQYVSLMLSLGQPAALLHLPGTLSLVFDADGDATTGGELEGLSGAEFAVDFSPPDSTGRPSEGVALRVAGRDGTTQRRDAHDVSFMSLPGYSARQFEMRVARGRQLGDRAARPTFTATAYRARLVFRDTARVVRDELPTFTVKLTVPFRPGSDLAQGADSIGRAPGTQIRVLQWNMADRGLLERPDVFRRIVVALAPDVLMLHEVNGELGPEGVARFLSSLDAGRAIVPWHFVMGEGGGYQRSIVASRNAVIPIPAFRFIPYPDSVAAELVEAAPTAIHTRLRNSLAAGVPTGGAIVEIAGKRLAAFPLDLQSAGNDPASWQERRRQAEARIIQQHVLRALAAHAPLDGIVIAGDMNLVATDRPLRILQEPGSTRGGRYLVAIPARQLGERSGATWDNGEGRFPPGRLDWFLYDNDAFHVRGAFVFDTRDLPDRWLATHGLRRDDSARASDHMPIVVDLAWKR